MRAAFTIARMTFVEARRNRVLWTILFFCLVLIGTSFVLQEVTIAAFDRVVRDMGMAAMNFFGLLLAVFLGVSSMTRDVERRTVYNVLSKPVTRGQYLAGKLLGAWLTLAISMSLMLVVLLIDSHFYMGPIAAVIFQAFWLMLIQVLVIASFALLASTFSSSIMSAFMSLSLYVIGEMSPDIFFAARKLHSEAAKKVGLAVFYLLPNLERLDLKPQASLLTHVSAGQVLGDTVYGLVYVLAFFLISLAIFSRRDLK